MSEVKDKVDFYELIATNQMTDELWQDLEAWVAEEIAKDWNEFLVRRENYDDAYYNDNKYFRNLAKLAANKGLIYEEVLAKDGEVVPCEVVNTKYGKSWIVKDSWGKEAQIVEWVNVSVASTPEKQQKHYAKKGYQIVIAEVRGYLSNGVVKPVWSDVKSVEVI